MPESATPEPSVMLASDAITLDPDSAPLTEQPTQIVQPGATAARRAPPHCRATRAPPPHSPPSHSPASA